MQLENNVFFSSNLVIVMNRFLIRHNRNLVVILRPFEEELGLLIIRDHYGYLLARKSKAKSSKPKRKAPAAEYRIINHVLSKSSRGKKAEAGG